jgi:hypothetical protein
MPDFKDDNSPRRARPPAGFAPGEVGIADAEDGAPSASGGPDLSKLARPTRRGGGRRWLLAIAVVLAATCALFVVASVIAPTVLLVRPSPISAEDRATLTGELRWITVSFDSAAGQPLVGCFGASGGRSYGTILFIHGLGDDVGERALAMDSFRDAGFDVLVFGQRGYGESVGEPDMSAMVADSLAAFDYLVTERRVNPRDVTVYGRGAGASAAASLCLERQVGAVVTEGAFTTLSSAMADHLLLIPASAVVSPNLDTLGPLGRCRRPILLLHGKDDWVVSSDHSERLYEAGSGPRLLKIVEGAGHGDLVNAKSPPLAEVLRSFLEVQRL